jgi:hypothetical protein
MTIKPKKPPRTLKIGQFGECAEAISAGGKKAVFVTAAKPTAADLRRLAEWCLQAAEWLEGRG